MRRTRLMTAAAAGMVLALTAACSTAGDDVTEGDADAGQGEGEAEGGGDAGGDSADDDAGDEGGENGTATGDPGSATYATVVKLDGVAWFDRMATGVEQFGEENGVDAFQQGPAQADSAQQVQVIEDLIAQGVDVLAVVPFQPDAVESVLGRPRTPASPS